MLDGVTSAIAMKEYIARYGIKTVAAHKIQYGDTEYAVSKPGPHTLAILVDYAHGKPIMKIHTDHHDAQVGVEKGTSTSFVKTPSNVEYLSSVIPNTDIFPQEDLKLISMVDSADFSKNGIEPDDVMRAAFGLNDEIDVARNRMMMGLVVNKLLLSYKNKPDFLVKLVLMSKPSLVNMYINIKKLAKENGYAPPEAIMANQANYVAAQKVSKNVKMVGSTIVQYGGGSMIKPGSYDRYTPFKNNPEARYLSMAWPVGLVQLAKNPFAGYDNPYNLGEIAMDVLEKYKSKLMKKISLLQAKRIFESGIKELGDQMGFTYKDLMALFTDKVKLSTKQEQWLMKVMDKKFLELDEKEKDFMYSLKITVWDIIKAQSGGHHDITNVSGWNFYGKGYVDLMKEFQNDLVNTLAEKEK